MQPRVEGSGTLLDRLNHIRRERNDLAEVLFSRPGGMEASQTAHHRLAALCERMADYKTLKAEKYAGLREALEAGHAPEALSDPDLTGLLTAALGDPSEKVQAAAMRALGGLRGEAAPAVPALIRLMGDRRANIRHGAGQALCAIALAEAGAAAAVVDALRDPDPDIRGLAATVLGSIGRTKPSHVSVPAMAALLMDQDPYVQAAAGAALGHMGPAARAAEPDLALAVRAKDDLVRAGAVMALGKIGISPVTALRAALKDHDPEVRKHAAAMLRRFGAENETGRPETPR